MKINTMFAALHSAFGACAGNLTPEPVNVLSLGVRNDGSEDISEIVNRETAKHALFFPPGKYKVAKPLYLKNPVTGAGYARQSKVTAVHTWFLSGIQCDDGSVGVLNAGGGDARNIENLTIVCNSHECGIRIKDEKNSPLTLIDKVGIFNVRGYGIHIQGRGSRPFFLQNLTIWGSRDCAVPCVGIFMDRPVDNRFSNIEIMGCRVSMEITRGFQYGNNLHLWTGCMGGMDNGSWWRGTRGIVLGSEACFNASEVYPDTAFYALETRGDKASFNLKNIFYWEDDSTKGAPDYDGAFFHGEGICNIDGGEIYVPEKWEHHGRMKQVRVPGTGVKNVLIRTGIPVKPENIDRLCAGNELPDYTMEYTEKGFCKAADIVLAAPAGCTDSVLSLDNGEAYRVRVLRRENGAAETSVTELNPLCRKDRVRFKELVKDVFSVFVLHDKEDLLRLRFRTETMGERFRPLHFGLLRNVNKSERNKQVLPELQ